MPGAPRLVAVLIALSAAAAAAAPSAARDLVIYLSPPGRKRGVLVSHGLYPPAERERVLQEAAQEVAATAQEERTVSTRVGGAESPSRAESAAMGAEVASLRSELDALRETVQTLAAEVRDLKTALGA